MADAQPFNQLVVIGASAGGIEALSTLVSTLPEDFPAPIVIAQHLDPKRQSHLADILTSRAKLPVHTVTDQAQLEPGVIFVVPANWHVEITDHDVRLRKDSVSGPKPSVDLLFQSAAAAYGEGLVAVVLTGTGSDGAAGARYVKETGGTVVIQNPDTASYPAMPQSLAPTTVDIVANLDQIGPLLYDLLTGRYPPGPAEDDRALRMFLEQLRERSGIDFNAYKKPTITRRLQRRVAATHQPSLASYIRHVERHPDEYQRLISSFLIKVTGFFRDSDLFEYIRERALPRIIEQARSRDHEIRIWSAGCATGEEPYSLAILVSELLGSEIDDFTVRIFATDLDADAVGFARRGVYTAAALAGMAPDMVQRYFNEIEGEYEIKKNVRTLVVFGQHDLGQRAPFPRIDLALCRNVLIYFTSELQKRALQLFAFALRDNGLLVLGKAETVNPLADFFEIEQPVLKVFLRHGERVLIPPVRITDNPPPPMRQPTAPRASGPTESVLARMQGDVRRPGTSGERASLVLMALPVGVAVVDRHYDIESINNAARRLLGIHTQAVGEDLVHLVQNLPSQPFRALIDAALRGEVAASVFEDTLGRNMPGDPRALHISCLPHHSSESVSVESVIVLINDVTDSARQRMNLESTMASEREQSQRLASSVQQLEQSMQQLLGANQELTEANAELRSANEELLVSNEEVFASTEEVETLNEEMQATNEELETLNEELQATVEELNTTNDDLQARSIELQEAAVTQEAQRRSTESERERLAAILARMADAVLVVDEAGTPLLANAAFEQTFGANAERLVPLDDQGTPLPPEAQPQQRAARGESFTLEFSVSAEGGDLQWFEAHGQSLTADGAPRGGVIVIRNITERSLRRLQEEFIERASHELRTPLTGLQLYQEMVIRLLAQAEVDPRITQYAGAALGQVRRLAARVNDLQDAAKLRHGGVSVTLEPMELAPVVIQAVETARLLSNDHTIEVDDAGSTLRVNADEPRMEQVVLNLLTNAVNHAPDSNRIDVRLRAIDGQAEIAVQDDGPGIPATVLPHLFSRFFRGGAEGKGPGLGLGLYISREIVAAHGGTIGVESTEGQGATFTVRLPLLDGATEQPAR